jgi:hypothetical protein
MKASVSAYLCGIEQAFSSQETFLVGDNEAAAAKIARGSPL